MIKELFKHKFLNKRYIICLTDKFKNKKTDGECDPPNWKNPRIRINQNLTSHKALEVCLHEALHAVNWTLDEEYVDQMAIDIAKFLYKMGFGLIEFPQEK